MTFLTAAQLKRMHQTEGAYFLNELTQLDLHVGLSLEAFRRGPLTSPLVHSGMVSLCTGTCQTVYTWAGLWKLSVLAFSSSAASLRHCKECELLSSLQCRQCRRLKCARLDMAVVLCSEGAKGVEVLHTVYQYNHQSGTLYLPLSNGSQSPVAIKVEMLAFTGSCLALHSATDC